MQRLSSSWWQREGRAASLSSITTRGTLALGRLVWSTENLEGRDFWAQEAQEAHRALRDSVNRTRKLLTAGSRALISPMWDYLSLSLHCGILSCNHKENVAVLKPGHCDCTGEPPQLPPEKVGKFRRLSKRDLPLPEVL